jgi:alpha-galactosidase
VINSGTASVEVDAVDEVAQLALRITIELTAGGLIRARTEIVNTGQDPYAVNDCVIAFPIPQVAREILDFAGHWGKERVPQRRPLGVGVHLREGRKGRTGPDAATLLHVGAPGFSFADGEIWAVHTGWSGNHTHYAERIFTGVQVIGGGELLLPGEVILADRPDLHHAMDLRLVRARPRCGGWSLPSLPAGTGEPSLNHATCIPQCLGGGLFRS